MPVDAAGLNAIQPLAAPPASFDPTASVPTSQAPVEPPAPSSRTGIAVPSLTPPPARDAAEGAPRPSDASAMPSSPVDERVPGPPPGTRSIDETTTAPDEDDDLLPALTPALPGITGATVLATAVLVALRHRQRQTRPRRRTRPTDAERAVVAAADVALVRWVGQELSLLGEHLAGRGFEATPVAVEFSEDSGIEILWDRPVPDAPAPWEAVPGVWSWRTLYDPEAPIPTADLPSVFAGFATIGDRDGRQLLVNLEAFGSIAVTGDPKRVDDFLRSIAVELSMGDEIADANLTITQGPLAESLNETVASVEVIDPTSAVSSLRSAAESTTTLLEASGIGTTFAYRMTDTPLLPLEVTIAIASTHDDNSAQALVEACPPHRGVGVLVTDPSAGASATVTIAADGRALFEPLDLAFTARSLPLATATEIKNLLDRCAPGGQQPSLDPSADASATTIYDAETGIGGLPAPSTVPEEASVRLGPDTGPRRGTVIDLRHESRVGAPVVPEPRMLVKVLGQPRIVDGPPLGRRELALVVYVACAGRPVRHDHIQDAIWGGDAVSRKSVFNLIGATRTALGCWDGEPILKRAVRPANTIALQPGVVTDIELLRSLANAAENCPLTEALSLLHRGLALIEGPAFDDDGYQWAHTDQVVSDAEALIQRTVLLASEYSLQAGREDAARLAIRTGIRALPYSDQLQERLHLLKGPLSLRNSALRGASGDPIHFT